MSKRDRQGVRTAADLERKYDFGKLNASQSNSLKKDIAVSELTQKVDQFIADTNGNFENINADIDDINENIDDINTDISGFNGAVSELNNKYTELSNKVDELEENGGGSTPEGDGETSWENVTNKPDTFPPSEHTHSSSDVESLVPCYTSLADIGLTAPVTTEQICEAMPYPSRMLLGAGNTTVTDIPISYGTIEISRATNVNYCAARLTQSSGNTPIVCVGKYSTNTSPKWTGWEFINPPMAVNTEYCTAEKYKWYAVYTKLINFGTMPNNTSKSVSIGANLNVVSIEGMTYNGNYALPLSIHNGINSVYYNKSDGKLYVETKSDASKWSAEIVVRYTK